MELEEMKRLWQAHEQSINKINNVNEKMLLKMMKEKSHNALEKIKSTEYFLGGTTFVFTIWFIFMAGKVGSQPAMICSYLYVLTNLVLTVAWSIYKLKYLSRININTDTLTDIAAKTARFRLYIAREWLISLSAAVVGSPAFLILVTQWMMHGNPFQNLSLSLVQLAIIIVFTGLISVAVYGKYYFSRLKEITNNLKEIEDFRREI